MVGVDALTGSLLGRNVDVEMRGRASPRQHRLVVGDRAASRWTNLRRVTRFAIDARPAVRPRRTGVGVYLDAILVTCRPPIRTRYLAWYLDLVGSAPGRAPLLRQSAEPDGEGDAFPDPALRPRQRADAIAAPSNGSSATPICSSRRTSCRRRPASRSGASWSCPIWPGRCCPRPRRTTTPVGAGGSRRRCAPAPPRSCRRPRCATILWRPARCRTIASR